MSKQEFLDRLDYFIDLAFSKANNPVYDKVTKKLKKQEAEQLQQVKKLFLTIKD
jgi:hypothetical protein